MEGKVHHWFVCRMTPNWANLSLLQVDMLQSTMYTQSTRDRMIQSIRECFSLWILNIQSPSGKLVKCLNNNYLLPWHTAGAHWKCIEAMNESLTKDRQIHTHSDHSSTRLLTDCLSSLRNPKNIYWSIFSIYFESYRNSGDSGLYILYSLILIYQNVISN